MKKITAVTIFETAAGTRMSMAYSEIDGQGVIVKDNVRLDRIIVDADVLSAAEKLMKHAQEVIDGLEG